MAVRMLIFPPEGKDDETVKQPRLASGALRYAFETWIHDWVNHAPEREQCVCVDAEIEKVCMGSRKKEKEALGVFRVIACARLFARQQESVNIIACAWRCCCVCIVIHVGYAVQHVLCLRVACMKSQSLFGNLPACSHHHYMGLHAALPVGDMCPQITMMSCMPETKNHS